jgi:hypothetical protein
LNWEAPSGSQEIFQGTGPAYLAPYLTIGKEFGNFHFLATTGYNFPAEHESGTIETYYANFHFDYRLGWFYPLVEFNGNWSNTTINFTPNFLPGLDRNRSVRRHRRHLLRSPRLQRRLGPGQARAGCGLRDPYLEPAQFQLQQLTGENDPAVLRIRRKRLVVIPGARNDKSKIDLLLLVRVYYRFGAPVCLSCLSGTPSSGVFGDYEANALSFASRKVN